MNTGVFVGIASFGRRAKMLHTAVESLLPQVDRIGVYLNNYPELPDFLDHPRIEVQTSADHGDLRDNGKFFFLDGSDYRFYAAADDDIHYPPDYIEVLKGTLAAAGPNSAVAVHGAVYPTPILDLFTSRHLFHFAESLQHVMPVHLVGTGTLLFDQSEWGLRFEEFGEPGMADVWFARSARQRSARLFVVNRDRDWLRSVDSTGMTRAAETTVPTLFAEAEVGRGPQVEVLRDASISEGGYESLVLATLQSPVFADRMTISQAIAFERTRRVLGWRPLDDAAVAKVIDRVSGQRSGWDVPGLAETDLKALTQAIAGALGQQISSETAIAAMDSLERLASLAQRDRNRWKSLPYALRFDTRPDRLELIRRELFGIAVETGPDNARAVWPRLSQSREDLSPELALALERADVDTDFQRLPALARVGSVNWARAGNLMREYFEMNDREPAVDVLAWRRIFGGGIETKGVQLLMAMTALRCGHREMARRCVDSLVHRWPGDPDVGVMEAALRGATGDMAQQRIKPVLENLDGLMEQVGVGPYTQSLSADVDPGHWISLLDANGIGPPPPASGTRPDVSVIMTVHNNEDTVVAAARSVLGAREVDVELLIVDDASTDSTARRVATLDDPRVTVLTNARNLGPYVSRNRALEVASGEFIAIADADDWSHPDRLAYQRRRLESDPSLVACTVAHLRVRPDGIPDLENHLLFLGDGPMTLVIRRAVIEQIGGFDHIRTRGDMEYLSRMRARFGEQAVASFGAPLVLSTSTPWSNSKRFTPEALDRYRIAFRDWHAANQQSDELYVPLAGPERARFIAPEELISRPV